MTDPERLSFLWREREAEKQEAFREGMWRGVLIGVGVAIFGWWVS